MATIDEHVYQLFQESDRRILYGLIARPSGFRNRRGIWFMDNTAALMSLIRGRSSSPDLENLAQVIHLYPVLGMDSVQIQLGEAPATLAPHLAGATLHTS